MTVNPARLQKLQEHGLTEYEARAYLALIDLGVAEASQIADLSRVPRTKIYQALDGLEGKRLLKVIPERPKRYSVEPFEGYLDELAKQFQARAEGVLSTRESLAAEFAPKTRLVLESSGGFLTLKGRSTIQSKVCEMIQRAERSLAISTSENGAHRIAYHADLLLNAHERGASVSVHCPASSANAEAIEQLRTAGSEVRRAVADLGSVTLIFVDDREVLLVHHVPDDRHHFQGSDVALWSDDAGAVAAMRAMLGLAWDAAPKIDSRTMLAKIPA